MKKLIQKGFPLYLLAVFVLAYGLQAPKLGFVLDDWVILYSRYVGGNQNLYQYAFLVNRPNLTWIWEAGFSLVGYSALGWQLFSLVFRYLAVLFTWLVWKRLFPRHSLEVSLAAGLFAVYPIFAQQASAISFSVHWVCLTLYTLSIYLMILAVQHRRLRIPLLALSVAAGALNVFSMEYFVGLELLRPVILWMLISRQEPARAAQIKKSLLLWAPFAGMLAIYVLYRFKWMPTPGYDRNSPVLLTNLLSSPLQTSATTALTVVRDLLNSLFGSWAATIQPAVINFDTPASTVALVLVMLAGLGSAAVVILQRRNQPQEEAGDAPRFYRSGLLYGLLAFIFGLAPVWLIGSSITASGNYADRFSLPILAGASLILVGLLDWMSQDFVPKVVVSCTLIGLAVGFQFRQESTNRYSWEKQLNTYWQLKWRIPQLQTPTVLYGDGVLGAYMGSWADDAAYNMLYPSKTGGYEGVWYFDLFKQLGARLNPATDISDKKMENLQFQGNSADSLVFQKQGVSGQCVWLLSSLDKDRPFVSSQVEAALQLSNLDRVVGSQPATLPAEIYGPEPAHTWCYFYEKADLARQMGQWDQIVPLWNAAQAAKAHPNVLVEYTPFILGAAHSGDWSLAYTITKQANDPPDVYAAYLCGVWADLKALPGADKVVLGQAQTLLACQAPLN